MKGPRFAIFVVIALLLGSAGGYAAGRATGKSQPAPAGALSNSNGGSGQTTITRTGSAGSTTAGSQTTTTAQTGASGSGTTQQGFTGFGGLGGGGFTAGTVQTVAGNKVTLTSRTGATVTVNLTAGTAVTRMVQGSISDITAGMNLTVMGTTQSDGSVAATRITATASGAGAVIGQYGGGGSGFGGGQGNGTGGGFARPTTGTAQSVSGNTITLAARDGSTVKVTVDSQTIIEKSVQGSAADIAVGESVIVVGSPQSDGSIDATSVTIAAGG